jgi:hypothetical protein
MSMDKTDMAANLLFGSRGGCLCDGCMAEAVNLDNRHEAQRIRSALGEFGSFSQDFDCCMVCGRETVVIRAERR